MKQKIYSLIVLIVFVVVFYLYLTIYLSSIMFEENRSVVNKSDLTSGSIDGMQKFDENNGFLIETFIMNPANLELYLKKKLMGDDTGGVGALYNKLLKKRPTWPYYYSGLIQTNSINSDINFNYFTKAMEHGKYERKVVLGISESIFSKWGLFNDDERSMVLNYLANQQEVIISKTVGISAKFAKIYQFCDFIYEKKHVEYAACKQNYWQPLTD